MTKKTRILIPLLVIVLISSWAPSGYAYAISPTNIVKNLKFKLIRDSFSFDVIQTRQKLVNEYWLQSYRLSDHEIKQVENGTVEIAPWDITLLEGNDLNWRPSPFFQYFLARTAKTDRINSSHLKSNKAADHIIWSWRDLDGTHPLHIAPLTHLTIIDRYILLEKTDDRFLLKRSDGSAYKKRHLKTVYTSWGKETLLPSSKNIIIAEVHTKRSLTGKIMKFLYRIPPVYIKLNKEDHKYRIIPGSAPNGILIEPLPRDPEQLYHFLVNNEPHPETPKNRSIIFFIDSHIKYFTDTIVLEFYELVRSTPG
ncbi:MAG: hypothetical protein JSV21_10910 [Nitrospirota bacterium]|nr:MAG: hypothetical protein JSV21_10910 [Nitrospirota bacterium]